MAPAFQLAVLGCSGGPREANLSGYLVSPAQSSEWVALDAGSLLTGIESALAQNGFPGVSLSDPTLSPAAAMLVKHVRAYLISHAHLDHICGLVLNSQIDGKKHILGIETTINNLRDHIFNGKVWPNYASEGLEPVLGKYQYVRLPLHEPKAIPGTEMTVEPFLLSHPNGYPSTAFLLQSKGGHLLYFGDTSSDELEMEKHLERVWKRIAGLLKKKSLHAILLECSFPHSDADLVVYGHLDTRLMMHELRKLSKIADVPLKGLKVVVTHRKENVKKGVDAPLQIQKELQEFNDLEIDFIFPKQGENYLL